MGKVDPYHSLNAVITDLQLVPRNGQRHVRYETTSYIFKPINSARGSGLLWWSAPNRGDERLFTSLNQGIGGSNDPTNPGDGLAMRLGGEACGTFADAGNTKRLKKYASFSPEPP